MPLGHIEIALGMYKCGAFCIPLRQSASHRHIVKFIALKLDLELGVDELGLACGKVAIRHRFLHGKMLWGFRHSAVFIMLKQSLQPASFL